MAFFMFSAIALVIVYLGIRARTADKPAGFFSNVEPPEVKNVKEYNKAVGNLFFFYAAGLELCGLPLIGMKQNSPLFVIPVLGVVFLTLGTIISYTFVESKYKK